MNLETLPNQEAAIEHDDFKDIIPELSDYAMELSLNIDEEAIKECLEVLSQYTDPAQAKDDLKKIWEAMSTESGLKSDLVDFNSDETI